MFVNSDFSELLRLFNAGKVRYPIVGGYAVVQYTETRFTADLASGRTPTLAMPPPSTRPSENSARRCRD